MQLVIYTYGVIITYLYSIKNIQQDIKYTFIVHDIYNTFIYYDTFYYIIIDWLDMFLGQHIAHCIIIHCITIVQ